MELRDVYVDFNDFYYYRLNSLIIYACDNGNADAINFFKKMDEKGIDFSKVLYKKLIDDYAEINVDSKKTSLLPIGIKNKNVPEYFVKKEPREIAGRYGSINVFLRMFFEEASWEPIYYHSNDSLRQVFKRLCDSYIEHYKKSLNETWSEDNFYERLSDLKYVSVKYARDLETGETFAIGFFGSLVKNGAGGQVLTDAELYVMPEFRNMGIAKRLVGLTFLLAKNDGIENFESITYKVQSCDALAFWKKIGATDTGLTHIEGDVSEIVKGI